MSIGENPQAERLLKAFHRFRKLDMRQIMSPSVKYKPSEVRLLFVIAHGLDMDERGVKVSELSAMLKVTAPTVTPLIRSLEEHGLVLRRNDKEDRRAVRVLLTDQGRAVIQKVARKRSEQLMGLVEHLGVEKSAQLSELLEQVYSYMESQANGNQAEKD